jgi:Domain of unknown function (DUF4129)
LADEGGVVVPRRRGRTQPRCAHRGAQQSVTVQSSPSYGGWVSASSRRTVIVVVAALGVALVMVLAASTGPEGMIGDLSADDSSTRIVPDEPDATSVPAEYGTDKRPFEMLATDLGDWLQDLLFLGLLLLGLWLAAGAVRLVVLRLARELPDKQLVLELDPLSVAEAGREAMRRDRGLYDAALAESDVRNGIVACWVLLEETAANVGIPRLPAETATELVVRFLHTLDVDPRPVATLARLYHEARFSTHELPADARTRAERALADIHADLARGAVT